MLSLGQMLTTPIRLCNRRGHNRRTQAINMSIIAW